MKFSHCLAGVGLGAGAALPSIFASASRKNLRSSSVKPSAFFFPAVCAQPPSRRHTPQHAAITIEALAVIERPPWRSRRLLELRDELSCCFLNQRAVEARLHV